MRKIIMSLILGASLVFNFVMLANQPEQNQVPEIVASQVAPDGECQVTFSDGTNLVFNANTGTLINYFK